MLRARALAELGLLPVALLAAGCGARTELAKPPPGYKVLFPSGATAPTIPGGGGTQTLSVWHSRTGAISTLGTYPVDEAALSFDGRFIATEQCLDAQLSCEGTGTVLDVSAPDGTIVWSQPETTGQVRWAWVGALRPDGQRIVATSLSDNFSGWLYVLDRQSTPVPIRSQVAGDSLTEVSYAPDGQTLVAVHWGTATSGEADNAIETMRDDGTAETTLVGPTPIDTSAMREPSFSFDGTAIVYLGGHLACDVDVVDVASRKSRTLYSGNYPPNCVWYRPQFTPDGSAIVIRDLDQDLVETLRRIDVATGEASVLWQGQLAARPWPSTVAVAVDE